MKKVVKGLIIGACVCIALGTVCFVGAAMAGGVSGAKEVLERDGFIGFSISGGTIGFSSGDSKQWDVASEHTIVLDDNNTPSLELELGAGEFEIVESSSKDIVIKSDKKIRVSEKNGKISIKAKDEGVFAFWGSNTCNVTIEIPQGTAFDEIDFEIGAGVLTCPELVADSLTMEIGAGTIFLEKYSCDKANVSVGAGEVIVNNGFSKDMDIDVGMGNFVFKGSVVGNLDVDCGMGNAEMDLEGSEEDFNYKIDCGMGNVTVGKSSYAGVGAGHEIDNGSKYDFDLDCGMGNLEIRFTE